MDSVGGNEEPAAGGEGSRGIPRQGPDFSGMAGLNSTFPSRSFQHLAVSFGAGEFSLRNVIKAD